MAQPVRAPDDIEPIRPPSVVEPFRRVLRLLPGDRQPVSGVPGIVAVVAAAALLVALGLVPVVMVLRAGIGAVQHRVLDEVGSPLRMPAMAERSTILAADGTPLEHIALDYDRHVVPLGRIDRITRRAVLAIEDHGFYHHGAIDPHAIVRAALTNLASGRVVEGGSTISQQLVKDVIVGDERTFTRKLHEAVDAVRLENTYTKRQILAMYLNEVYFGNGTYGVAAAAEFYFGMSPRRLTLPRAALLAALIRSPSFSDPLTHPNRALHRRNYVLKRMRDLGWIDEDKLRWARHAPLGLSAGMHHDVHAGPDSYWTQYVINQFLQNRAFGKTPRARARLLFQGGIHVYTTLDRDLQRKAERVLEQRMGGPGMPQSALVSIDPSTGAIEAMAVGNQGWGPNDQYDLAVDPGGGRTAGSAFKAFTLAAALERGVDPNTIYNGDSPKTIPDCGGGETWTLHNAEPGGGSFPLWLATADSVNTVFAQVIDQVGPQSVADVAHAMGITNDLVPVCPLTLGTSPVSPLQMTSGYATLANRGVHCPPYAISKVVDSTGSVIFRQKPDCVGAIPRKVADEETAMLANVIKLGTGTAADIGRPAAGKTGTGQDYQDAWFIGYTPQLVTGVWVGYAKAEIPMPDVPGYGTGFGGTLAAPIWHDFMLYATRDLAPLGFPPPPIPFGHGSYSSPSPTTAPPPPPGHGHAYGHGHGHGPPDH